MNLESHPVLHYVFIMVSYNLGLLANVLLAAHLSISSTNNAIKTLKEYFALRWLPLSIRWAFCIAAFLVGWNNVSLGLEKFMDESLAKHIGMAWFLGFASDEFVSKVLALIGMQKDLPPVPHEGDPL